jgi:hypothetical protein
MPVRSGTPNILSMKLNLAVALQVASTPIGVAVGFWMAQLASSPICPPYARCPSSAFFSSRPLVRDVAVRRVWSRGSVCDRIAFPGGAPAVYYWRRYDVSLTPVN